MANHCCKVENTSVMVDVKQKTGLQHLNSK